MLQFARVADLADAAELSRLFGPVASVGRSPLAQLGYSGALHERFHVRLGSGERIDLFLKRSDLALDWTAYRSGDASGREGRLLQEPSLSDLWSVFGNPYHAWAAEPGQIGLLLDDLSDHLLPDVDEPIAREDEDALLGALARLHARYWESDVLALSWLVKPSVLFGIMGPRAAAAASDAPFSDQWRAMLRTGWQAALARLPAPVAALLTRPADELARQYEDLPRTLLHGDAKVANFALLPGNRVAAFDWEWVSAGPATLDVGWYVAVNSGRLARSKEAVLARYRDLLEAELGAPLPDGMWSRMVQVGVLCGALMLLWNKALVLVEAPTPHAEAEWQWWAEALASLC